MLIVLTIIVIVTAVAVAGQRNFDRTLSLNNAAYSIALTLREMQSYGISSRAYTGGISNTGYGVSFVKAASMASYATFTDLCTPAPSSTPDAKRGNGFYDLNAASSACDQATMASESMTTYTLNNGFSIKRFCAQSRSTGNWRCSNTSTALGNLDIVFRRPETDAIITARVEGAASASSNYKRACIQVEGTSGDTRTVLVTETGQISVTGTACPI